MKIRHLLVFALVIAALTIAMVSCGSAEMDLDGKSIVTFQLKGGILDFGTSMTSTYIKYAYEPGTYVLDPVDKLNCKLTKNGYIFTGWYTDENCTPDKKWNFSTLVGEEPITLFAGWEKAINFTYTVCYTDGDTEVVLGSYKVNQGEKFEDWKNYYKTRKGYTPVAYYADSALTEKWDFDTVHPGGEQDLDIKIYVDYIEGDWALVYSFTELSSALSSGKNVYLMNDIDCGSSTLSSVKYNGTFEGNGHSVKSFTVNKGTGTKIVGCSIFTELGEKAVVRNISFKDVTYNFDGVSAGVSTAKVAALAIEGIVGAKVENVSVEGKLITNYTGTLNKLDSAVYEVEENKNIDVSGFTASITVNPAADN